MGIVLVSHVELISKGLMTLLKEFCPKLNITYAQVEEGNIGTTFDSVQQAIEENGEEKLLIFYDIGSSKMNAELAQSIIVNKEIIVMDVAMIEGAFLAANLINVESGIEDITNELKNYAILK